MPESANNFALQMNPLRHLAQWSASFPVAAWNRRDALTVLARWPLLRRIDRPLAFILGLEPRMLSSRVIVVHTPIQGTTTNRVSSWLWEKHSVKAGIYMSLAVGSGMCLLALGVSSLFSIPMLGLKDNIDGIPTMILAAAAYLGGLFGFLQAVTIFAVQLRSQQDTSMLPLTPLIARRYFTFFILGAIAGVTIANLVAAFAAPVLPVSRTTLGALSWLNLIAVPVATIAALWYLATIVSEAGEADMDVALPILRATMRAQTHADAHKVEMLNEYGRCLDEADIKYDPFANTRLQARAAASINVSFTRQGSLCDLDCHRFSKLARMLKSIPSLPQAAVTIAVGQDVQSDSALILTWAAPETAASAAQASVLVSNDLQKKLQAALASSFIVRKRGRA